MKTTRYSTPRQKACHSCSVAKAKCDRKAGSCGRCALRGLSCNYPQSSTSVNSVYDPDLVNGAGLDGQLTTKSMSFNNVPTESEIDIAAGIYTSTPLVQSIHPSMGNSPNSITSTTFTESFQLGDLRQSAAARSRVGPSASMTFSDLELTCPINVDDISIRWMNSYVPVPGQTIKAYLPSTTAFMYRVLKSYASSVIRGRGLPPFVHASEMTTASTSPITTCLSLVRICDKSLPNTDEVTAEILKREMNTLYERHGTCDDMSSLATFQAYLIYSMVLFFHFDKGVDTFLRQAIIALQEIACSSSRRGLLCLAEQEVARPRWESWIVAEAKRRTIFTMYLFDSVLSSQDGLPTFLGTELRGLPAPSSKNLWQAATRNDWERAYNLHLVDWAEGGLTIDELWPIPAELDEHGIMERRRRVDLWLENIDEYGTMIYAVTSSTHGG